MKYPTDGIFILDIDTARPGRCYFFRTLRLPSP